MKPIEYTLAPTVVIDCSISLEDFISKHIGFWYTVQILTFNSLDKVSAYAIQKAHLEREDKVYLLNKKTLELAYIPKIGVDALTLLLSTEGIQVLETLPANSVI